MFNLGDNFFFFNATCLSPNKFISSLAHLKLSVTSITCYDCVKAIRLQLFQRNPIYFAKELLSFLPSLIWNHLSISPPPLRIYTVSPAVWRSYYSAIKCSFISFFFSLTVTYTVLYIQNSYFVSVGIKVTFIVIVLTPWRTQV